MVEKQETEKQETEKQETGGKETDSSKAVKLGYLLPTRENIMRGEHSGRLLLDQAKHASDCGIDSLWAGDSLIARPRHDPLTVLAAVAGAIPHIEVGTAVLLPNLRNPIILAQQLATIDQISAGKLIVGAGIGADTPAARAEFVTAGVAFEKRVGRLLETFRLCRALWRGEPVNWDGRWQVSDSVLAPTTHRPAGPPIWIGSTVDAALARTAKHFDGWLPLGPNANVYAERRNKLEQAALTADKQLQDLTCAVYLTVAVMDDAEAADQAINSYLEDYYHVPAAGMRAIQACFGGPLEEVMAFILGFVHAGAEHIVLRIVGDHEETLKKIMHQRNRLIP